MIRIHKVCAGNYQVETPLGSFGLWSHTSGWTLSQYTPENGTINLFTHGCPDCGTDTMYHFAGCPAITD